MMWRINKTEHTTARHMVERVPLSLPDLGVTLLFCFPPQLAGSISMQGVEVPE